MTAIQNFAFEENLVRVVELNGEPWFVGKDVCHALAISKYRDALATLDQDEGRPVMVDTLGGNQEMVGVSEPGVYRLVFRSRKPEAERFKRWLAHEVLPAIRRTGRFGASAEAGEDPRVLLADAPLAARVDAVRLAARLWGRDRARSLWSRLGLPAVPPPPAGEGVGEARACLDVLAGHEPPGGDGRDVRQLVIDAVDGDEQARLVLLPLGLRIREESEGVLVANVSAGLEAVYAGTEWQRRGWRMPLRRLPGALAHGTVRFAQGAMQAKATFLPLDLFDPRAG